MRLRLGPDHLCCDDPSAQRICDHDLPERSYSLHDREVLVTHCGRICMHRNRINISHVLAGQRLGIKEVDDGIWLDLEQRTLQPLDNRFGPRLSPIS